MRRSLNGLALVAVVYATTSLLPAASPADWDGFYVGVTGGTHTGSRSTVQISGSPLIVFSQSVGTIPYRQHLDRNGSVFGIACGYNQPVGPVLLGVETDYLFDRLKGRDSFDYASGSLITSSSIAVDNLMTLRGRVGYAPSERWMVAFTGGLATAKVEAKFDIDESMGTGRQWHSRKSDRETGWAAGVEATFAATKHFLVRADYVHYDLGKTKSAQPIQTNPDVPTTYAEFKPVKVDGDLIRLALMYRF